MYYSVTFAAMAQKKLKRFNELKTFTNALEYPEGLQGEWNKFFNNNNPVILELACGKGEYVIGLSQLFPSKNFIGVDVKGNRMWVGASIALKNNLNNAGFLRTQIDKISEYFAGGEVNEIWITFPDPHLRKSKARKRLTHPKFLRMYKKFLKPDGLIHLKTDSPDLYQFTKAVVDIYGLHIITDTDDLYKNENIAEELKIKTHYESLDIAKSNKIFYLSFTLPENILEDDEKLIEFINIEPVDV